MVRVTQIFVRVLFLSFLWLVIRFGQFLLEISRLHDEAGSVSNGELGLQCRIKANLKVLVTGENAKGLYV